MSQVLLRSQVDRAPQMIKRQGRMCLEKDQANSPRHFLAAVQEHQEQMIMGMAQQGLQFVEKYGFEITGPFTHLSFAEDSSVDPGPQSRPDPRDVEGMRLWGLAEQARTAKKTDAEKNLVDFVLIGVFIHPGALQFGSMATGRLWVP